MATSGCCGRLTQSLQPGRRGSTRSGSDWRRCYTETVEWLRDNRPKVHLVISPLGTLLVSWVLVSAIGAGQWWSDRSSLELTGQIVPLGGVIYGSGIMVLEATGRMLWALAERQRDIDRGREEGRAEGRREGRQEGMEEAIRKLLERGVDLPPDVIKDIEKPEQK